jgi:adenine-specific DNA-methyltransferase
MSDLQDLSKEELIKEVQRLSKSVKSKRFGLVWQDIPEAFDDEAETKLPILEEVEELGIKNTDGKQTHVLIEGDNYHALTCLNYSHRNKVDVIYIDPPYNTGSDGFRYKDKRILSKFPDGTPVPKDSPYRHSYWLSFMAKRLELARDLLKDTGVIFVSIDDNEISQLKLLMDQIFDGNFIAQYIHKNNSSKNQANLVSVSTEYMLCYAKNFEALQGVKWRTPKKGAQDIANAYKKLKQKGLSIEEIEAEIKDLYGRPKYSHLSRWNKIDDTGVFVDADLSREGGSKDYTITNPDTGQECVVPERGWGKSLDELTRLQQEELIWYGDPETPPRMKVYIDDENPVVPDNFLYFDNSVDTRMIKTMFGSLIFENPKPLEMIKTIIRFSAPKDGVILDFFAGSGTTAQAVLELNLEDEGNRQFIINTNNENNIMDEVCHPRIKYVINGFEGYEPTGGSVKYYKTAFVGNHPIMRTDDEDSVALAQKAGYLLALAEGTLEMTEHNDYYQLFTDNTKNTAIYFREELGEYMGFVDKVNALNGPTTVFVFSWGDTYAVEDFLANSNVTVKTIPKPILEIYKSAYNLEVS